MDTEQAIKHNSNQNQHLRETLLDVAEELFSEKGFDAASVRDITRRAGCNVAAINYYFSSKDNLYVEVFRRKLLKLRDIRLESIEKAMSGSEAEPTLENLLRAFSTAFLEPLVTDSSSRRLMKLVAREMLDPHLPKGKGFEEIIKPTLTEMSKALLRLYPGLTQEKTTFCILSLIGQLLQVIRTKEMTNHMQDVEMPEFDMNEAIEHIVLFSAAGIRAAAGQ